MQKQRIINKIKRIVTITVSTPLIFLFSLVVFPITFAVLAPVGVLFFGVNLVRFLGGYPMIQSSLDFFIWTKIFNKNRDLAEASVVEAPAIDYDQ